MYTQYGGDLDVNCFPTSGGTIHSVFIDDSFNILISNDAKDTLFPGIPTALHVGAAIASLQEWAETRVSRSLLPIGCFTRGNKLYYIFRVRKPLEPPKLGRGKSDKEVWAAPYTAIMAARTLEDSEVVKKTLVTVDYNFAGRPVLGAVIFPEDPENAIVVNRNIGGSTGAVLVKAHLWGADHTFVKKTAYKNKTYDHLREECLADRFYMEFGAQVPPFRKYEYDDKVVKLGAFLPGGKPISNNMEKSILQQHFIVDAFLANWDVLGMEADNVLVYNGIPVRIDNGGSLRFRAQGQQKRGAFSAAVNEIYSMRCKGDLNSPYCDYFASLSDNDVEEQIREFVPRARYVVGKLYDIGLIDNSLISILVSRIDWLESHEFP